MDLLYWGIAFGTTGPARALVSSDWSPQTAGASWPQIFPSGLNYAFADCDGNGEVDGDDYDNAIEENFGLTHGLLLPDGFANASPGGAPRLRLVPSATLVEPGAIIDIDLFLDDSDQTVDNFYGIALKMSYTTGLLMDDPDFDFTEDSWLEAGDDDAQELFFDGDGSGAAELAFTRTNRIPVSVGTEPIGQIHVIVEDIIVGLEVDTFVIQIDSVLVVGADFTTVATVPDTVRIIVAKDTSALTSANGRSRPARLAEQIKIFPNPAQSGFHLTCPVPVVQLTLIDPLGRSRELISYPGTRQRIPLPADLSAGLYCLRLRTTSGTFVKKIMITR